MIKRHEQQTIYKMLDNGFTLAEIAKRTGRSIGTIYNYKKLGGKLQGHPSSQESIPVELDPYVEFLNPRIKSRSIKQTSLFFMLQRQGYQGPRRLFDRYYEQQRQYSQPQRLLKHVETLPGEQAQVDWGHFGVMVINGKPEKVYLFAYILSWSRELYMEFVVRQNQKTLQTCHIHAFEKIGMPKTIVYDNMKTVVNRREKLPDGQENIVYNLRFLDFARYYQFEVKACPPYWPRAKGKVESSIKLARQVFSRSTPKVTTTLEEMNDQLQNWLDNTANQRKHGTTHEKPHDRWLLEKEQLSFPEDLPLYNVSPFQVYRTTQHGILNRKGIFYNLGPEYARLKLEVHEVEDRGLPHLEIYRDGHLITTVPIPTKRHTWVSVGSDTQKKQMETPNILNKKQVVAKNNTLISNKVKIVVEQRDIDYYTSAFNLIKGVHNG